MSCLPLNTCVQMVQRGSRWELILSWLYVVLIRRFTFLSLFSASSRPNGHSLSSTDKQKIDTEITQLHDDPLMTSPTDPQAAATTKTSAAETDQAARDLQGPVDEPSTKAVAQDETVALTNETNPTSADHNTTTAVTTGMPTLSTTSTPANSHPPRVLPPVPAPVPDQTPPLVHRSTTRQRQLASRQTMPSFIQPSGSNHHGSSLAQSGGGHRRTVSAISGLGSRDAHRDPLLLAVRRQQPLAVHKLLKTSSGSKEMMYHAITCGRTDEREEGYNLLHYAVSSRCPEILHTLLEGLPEYMRPSAADSHGDTANLYTPLHLAAQKNEYMCASYLLQHQANPNTASKVKVETCLRACMTQLPSDS